MQGCLSDKKLSGEISLDMAQRLIAYKQKISKQWLENIRLTCQSSEEMTCIPAYA
jgi:hypothetical protein